MKRGILRSRRRQRASIAPEINLTPLIDTALTLLVIFMVTSPIVQNAIKINLPKGQSQEAGKGVQEIVATIDKGGDIYLNNSKVTVASIGSDIKKIVKSSAPGSAQSVWVRVDGQSHCDALVGVIDQIKMVGGIKDVRIAMERA